MLGLKNAKIIHQRAIIIIFHDFLHNLVKYYVDDLVVKTKDRGDHLHDLRKVFENLPVQQLKMNPIECAFGVTSGNFLSFVVRKEGIEIDPDKVEDII